MVVSEAQVNHHIYSKTDLMATDSFSSAAGLGVTVRPPPGFLSSLRQPVFLPTPLPGKQDEASLVSTRKVAAAGKVDRNTRINNRRNSDGSYSFR